MASPRIQDGYTRIANEILETLGSARLTTYQWNVLMVVIRKTYGFGKKMDQISLRQLSRATGMLPQHVARTLKSLVARNILKRDKLSPQVVLYGVQKDYDLWKPLPERVLPNEVVPDEVVPNEVKTSTSLGTGTSTSLGTNKRKKETTKEKASFLSAIMEKTIRRLNGVAGTSYRSDSKSTLGHINARLNEGYTEADLIAVVEDRCRRWKGDAKMEEYLRPSTLFNAGKFEGYLQMARANGNDHTEPPKVISRDGTLLVLADGSRISAGSYQRRYGITPCMK